VNRYLAIYLNDHLAGSTVGVELVRRAAREHPGELGVFLGRLAHEIEEDRATLLDVMGELGVREQRARTAAAWAAEKIGRLKPNGHLMQRSPLTPLVELEGLELGVFGKRRMWLVLAALTHDARFDALAERAERQLEELEAHRLAVASVIAGSSSRVGSAGT
jgi:hypothetical protein